MVDVKIQRVSQAKKGAVGVRSSHEPLVRTYVQPPSKNGKHTKSQNNEGYRTKKQYVATKQATGKKVTPIIPKEFKVTVHTSTGSLVWLPLAFFSVLGMFLWGRSPRSSFLPQTNNTTNNNNIPTTPLSGTSIYQAQVVYMLVLACSVPRKWGSISAWFFVLAHGSHTV